MITKPTLGAQLVAQVTGKSLTRAVEISGTASAGGHIEVDGRCAQRPCRTTAVVDAAGRWNAVIRLRTTRGRRVMTLDASYDEPGPRLGVPASVSVKLLEGPPEEIAVGNDPGGQEAAVPSDEPSDAASAATPRTSPTGGRAGESAGKGGGAPSSVLVVGDSLAVGMGEALRVAMSETAVSVDARIGRPLAEGMRVLSETGSGAPVVALSLFTNDDPRAVSALEAAARTSIRGRRCAVWSTVVRPPVGGIDYGAANHTLRRLAASSGGRLRIAEWDVAVSENPSLLMPDGVHATPSGYRVRARLYAQALSECP